MATKPESSSEVEDLRESNRKLSEALRQCRELLAKTERLLRITNQDNEPVK